MARKSTCRPRAASVREYLVASQLRPSRGDLLSYEQRPGECIVIPDGYWHSPESADFLPRRPRSIFAVFFVFFFCLLTSALCFAKEKETFMSRHCTYNSNETFTLGIGGIGRSFRL